MNLMMPRHKKPTLRAYSGSFTAEYAAILIVIIVGLMFPLVDLATVAYRYNIVNSAAQSAVQAVATSPTFSAGDAAANTTVQNILQRANGVTNPSSRVRIKETNLSTQVVAPDAYDTPLAASATPATKLYTVEVEVKAKVWPIAPIRGGIIPDVPGLNAPMDVVVASQQFVENTGGLNK